MKKILLPAIALCVGNSVLAQTHFSDDFNDVNLTGWTNVDNDADNAPASGTNYDLWYAADFSGTYAALGAGSAVSRSWAANVVYNPNNFLISPAINLTGASATGLSLLYKMGTIEGAPYHAEHYAVYVTTSADPAVIVTATPVLEETIPAVGMFDRIVDLAAFAGQTVYVTIRHFNTVDMNTLIIDDVAVKNVSANDAALLGVSLNRYSLINTNNALSLSVKNDGSSPITALTVNWNDGTDHSAVVTGLNIAAGATGTVSHPAQVSYSSIVEKSLAVSITQVNGATDASAGNNDGTALINTVSFLADKNVVIEEGTGTWCGWCPRGAVAMEDMSNNHPTDFIGIAVHNGDVMTVTEYDSGASLSGYPGCNVDRAMKDQSVSSTLFEDYYNLRKDVLVPAALGIAGSQTGSDMTIEVSAKFFTNFSAADFRLAAIIVEDNVTGTASGYNQTNYYSSTSQNLPLTGAGHNWQTEPNPVPAANMEYDHVGRALLGGYNGQAGSVPAAITDGQTVSYTFNYTVPGTSTVADMHIVAVLIDQVTGEIVNAAKADLGALSISDKDQFGMEVYPNPATDAVNVKFEGNGGTYTITLNDLAGREVAASSVSNASGVQTVAIPVSELKAGSYLVTIATGTTSYTTQVVVR